MSYRELGTPGTGSYRELGQSIERTEFCLGEKLFLARFLGGGLEFGREHRLMSAAVFAHLLYGLYMAGAKSSLPYANTYKLVLWKKCLCRVMK